jgi:hypothetical protein
MLIKFIAVLKIMVQIRPKKDYPTVAQNAGFELSARG